MGDSRMKTRERMRSSTTGKGMGEDKNTTMFPNHPPACMQLRRWPTVLPSVVELCHFPACPCVSGEGSKEDGQGDRECVIGERGRVNRRAHNTRKKVCGNGNRGKHHTVTNHDNVSIVMEKNVERNTERRPSLFTWGHHVQAEGAVRSGLRRVSVEEEVEANITQNISRKHPRRRT